MEPRLAAFGLACALGVPATVAPAGAQEPFDAATRAEVARAAAEALEQSYVMPDAGTAMAELLRNGADRGAWDGLETPLAFAERLTAELNAIAHDLHLRITPPGPSTGAGPTGARRVVRRAPAGAPGEAPDSGAPGRTVVRVPGGGRAPAVPDRRPAGLSPELPASLRIPGAAELPALDELTAPMRDRVEQERRDNHYFRTAEVLPGNVGYLDLDQFPIMPYAAPAADAAMLFLANVDAFILDLRGNPGGGEGMNQYLGSFFFTDSVHLYSRYYRPDDETREYWTLPELTPVQLPDVPLLMLVDGRSGSAAENMAFNLKSTGRATVVGETTAGAGHSSTRIELPHGFSMVVPIARVFDPRTGAGFEGTGVEPDVAVASDDALITAHGLAIEALADLAGDPDRISELEQAGALFAARSRPALPPEDLADYAGSYGNRRVWVRDGRVMLQRTDVADAPEFVLLNTGPDRFVLEAMPRVRIEFTRGGDGEVRSIRVLNPMGQWEESERR